MFRNKVSVYVDDVRIDSGELVLAESALNMKERMAENTHGWTPDNYIWGHQCLKEICLFNRVKL